MNPAGAQDGFCAPQAAGQQSCRQARVCECQYFPGGLLGGQGQYRWDCGVRRPSCLGEDAFDGELEGIRDFVRSVLGQEETSARAKLTAAPARPARADSFAGLLGAVAGLGPLPEAPARGPRVLRQPSHGLDQAALQPVARTTPEDLGPRAWRMAKAPVAVAGDRFAQLQAAAADQGRRLELRIAKLEAELTAERRQTKALRSRVETADARFDRLTGRLEDMRAGHQSALDRMTGRAYLTVGTLEEAIAMTGLDLRALLPGDVEAESGLGGPFIPSGSLDAPEPVIAMENAITVLGTQMSRWEQLHDLLGSLPLSAPLDQYQVTSVFGPRRDPVNGKNALHKGIDLKAKAGTPVMATAPGRVLFAGWRGRFGRTVEIDHGYGIVTRYAHLRKILVKRGEPVAHRQTIGLLGSSGRSTGPHVHYEIMAESSQLDPVGFFEAGLHLFKAPGLGEDRTAEVAAE